MVLREKAKIKQVKASGEGGRQEAGHRWMRSGKALLRKWRWWRCEPSRYPEEQHSRNRTGAESLRREHAWPVCGTAVAHNWCRVKKGQVIVRTWALNLGGCRAEKQRIDKGSPQMLS